MKTLNIIFFIWEKILVVGFIIVAYSQFLEMLKMEQNIPASIYFAVLAYLVFGLKKDVTVNINKFIEKNKEAKNE